MPNVHGLSLLGREMISFIATMIFTCVRGGETNGIGHCHPSRTLMIVDPVTATPHVMDENTGFDIGPRTTPDPAPLWRVVVSTVMVLGMVHIAPIVPFSLKETDMVGQGLW